jgi:hypothetical protein
MLAILHRRSFQDTQRWKVKYTLRTMFSTTVVLQFREPYERIGLVRSFIQSRFTFATLFGWMTCIRSMAMQAVTLLYIRVRHEAYIAPECS